MSPGRVRRGETSALSIEPRQQQLLQAAIELESERLPLVLEAHIDAAAKGVRRQIRRHLQIELEEALQGLLSLRVARIDRRRSAPARAQRFARELVLR